MEQRVLTWALQHSDPETIRSLKDIDLDSPEWKEKYEILKAVMDSPSDFDVLVEYLDKYTNPDSDIDTKVDLLEEMEMLLSNIDLANDFVKLDNFSIIIDGLQSEEPLIQIGCAWIVGTIAQNNPIGRDVVLSHQALDYLLILLADTNNRRVRGKAIYALSAILKNNPEVVKEFENRDGLEAFINILRSGEDTQNQSKTLFVMNSLIPDCPSIIDMGNVLIPIIEDLLKSQAVSLIGNSVSILLSLLDGNNKNRELVLNSNIPTILMNFQEQLESTNEYGDFDYEIEVLVSIISILYQ
eukprot:TRINITY_DN5326_c0_g1_i1.p1 TRINITY_DN5326_c0_g1~~TRINITY_DN5326_c0_g1_i1.p1  ORF type:complete len:298 (-),score=77.66 TRINITY_DN5326_c0_g1_i1:22-915(-)